MEFESYNLFPEWSKLHGVEAICYHHTLFDKFLDYDIHVKFEKNENDSQLLKMPITNNAFSIPVTC